MFLQYKSLNGREAYDFYRENRIAVAPGLNQYAIWQKAINGLMKTIQESLVETEGGVYIEGWGYFMNVMHLKKKYRVGNNHRKTKIKDFEKYYHYTPHFRPDIKFEPFGFDRSFSEFEVKRKIRLAAKAGKKYKVHLKLVKSVEAAYKTSRKWDVQGRRQIHL